MKKRQRISSGFRKLNPTKSREDRIQRIVNLQVQYQLQEMWEENQRKKNDIRPTPLFGTGMIFPDHMVVSDSCMVVGKY